MEFPYISTYFPAMAWVAVRPSEKKTVMFLRHEPQQCAFDSHPDV
jgi:hypothetical protein